MEENDLVERIRKLEYHMRLMAVALNQSEFEFNKLIIAKGLAEADVAEFFELCERMNKLMEEQKAEGFVYFHPLFQEFVKKLPAELSPREVVHASIRQKLFIPLMNEFKKFV